jgi:hypothetical protein
VSRQCARVPASVHCLAGTEILSAAATGVRECDSWGRELGDGGGVVIEASVVEAHEGFFVFLEDGGVVAGVQLRGAVLDVASPFVGHVGLELRGFAAANTFGNHDAGAQGEVVGILVFIDGSEEVGKGVRVDVGEVIVIGVVCCVDAVNAGRVGVRSVLGSNVRGHGCDEVLEGLKR